MPNCTISFRVVPQQKLRGRTNVRSSISAADSTGNNNNWMFLNGVSKAKFHEVEMKLKKLETRNSNLQLANDQQAAKWIRLGNSSSFLFTDFSLKQCFFSCSIKISSRISFSLLSIYGRMPNSW